MEIAEFLAHSAPREGAAGQEFGAHVRGVVAGALANVDALAGEGVMPPDGFREAVRAAAFFHDLGKLDPDIQRAFRLGRGARLDWDHVDAGCAHLVVQRNRPGAFIVRGHHAPGLPAKRVHFNKDDCGARLRGRRGDGEIPDAEQTARTDRMLAGYLQTHRALLGAVEVARVKEFHGLALRMALSCMIDGDHSDTAAFDTARPPRTPYPPRWGERLAALDAYVGGLSDKNGTPERNRLRRAFFDACHSADTSAAIVACEGPVGIGKTTAVAAYLLRAAIRFGLRHLIVVAPFTNIVSQTAAKLREALTLDGEDGNEVVMEHHHRADFAHIELRDLAAVWRAPVIVTTAVQLFETLAACHPASLRKLHQLPRSAVFIDEAHAALPVALWRQNWKWLDELATRWGCRFVLASGSLARFWENSDIVAQTTVLPELMPAELAAVTAGAEKRRVRISTAGQFNSVDGLIAAVRQAPGPWLVILNTVQNAAVVARAMRDAGIETLHLSTALCPRDRSVILDRVRARLNDQTANASPDWVLVATSCVEAGVDLSFRTAFRERFSVASLLQVAGRVNRHGDDDAVGGGEVFDFTLAKGDGINAHPAARHSAPVLEALLAQGAFADVRKLPADLVTAAMAAELRENGTPHQKAAALVKAEADRDYPQVAELGRVIDADTRLVVVDEELGERLRMGIPVGFRALLDGSVQIWAYRIERLGLIPLNGRTGVYLWPHKYDEFLGYMAGALELVKLDQTGSMFF